MKVNIYVDFENKKVYTDETLYQKTEEMAREYDEMRGDEFEDFLRREEGYSIYDIFSFDADRQEEILKDYHDYNVSIALDGLENDLTTFKINI